MANLVGLAEESSIFDDMEDLQRLPFLLVLVVSQTFADFDVLALRSVFFSANAVRLSRDALQLQNDIGTDLEGAKIPFLVIKLLIRGGLVKLSFSLTP